MGTRGAPIPKFHRSTPVGRLEFGMMRISKMLVAKLRSRSRSATTGPEGESQRTTPSSSPCRSGNRSPRRNVRRGGERLRTAEGGSEVQIPTYDRPRPTVKRTPHAPRGASRSPEKRPGTVWRPRWTPTRPSPALLVGRGPPPARWVARGPPPWGEPSP